MIKRLEDYVDTEALLRDPQAPEPPYWAHVWPGSRYLARVMAQNDCAGRPVVDIGCGLGLAGIVAALRGARVTMIDAASEGVRFARANAELNGLLPGPPPFGTVEFLANRASTSSARAVRNSISNKNSAHPELVEGSVSRLSTDSCAEGCAPVGSVAVVRGDIRSPGLRGRFDYCLAADVTYDPALQTAVAVFLAEHLSPTGRAWCAESVRTFDHGFHHACAARGLRTIESEVREPDEHGEVPVRVTEVRWP
jgi:predicted nicotinamide N-methyase